MTFCGKRIAVSLPDTLLEEENSLREMTAKVGIVARACSIFGVDMIEIYRDMKGRGNADFIAKILSYLETPQYLRKRIFRIDKELAYVGILPPLRIPSHREWVSASSVRVGEIREGIVNRDGSVFIGLDKDAIPESRLEPGKRVTVMITSREPLTCRALKREEIREYWGYSIKVSNASDVYNDDSFELIVSTSRFGEGISSVIKDLKKSISLSGSLKIVFGSPRRGLFDIFGSQVRELSDFTVNLFAEQHVQTVRTEEAVFCALSLINFLISDVKA